MLGENLLNTASLSQEGSRERNRIDNNRDSNRPKVSVLRPSTWNIRSFRKQSSVTNQNRIITRQRLSLSDLPAELLHIILRYYASAFQDLLRFAALNKTCQTIANYSLLWIELPLVFYVSRSYLMQSDPQVTLQTSIPEYVNTAVNEWMFSFQVLTKYYFSQETVFPPVLKVEVLPPDRDTTDPGPINPLLITDPDIASINPIHTSISRTNTLPRDSRDHNRHSRELDYELANRVRQWFIPFYNEYRSLWDWHARWKSTLYSIISFCQLSDVFFFGCVCVAIGTMTFAIYCFHDVDLHQHGGLTIWNEVGFMNLYLILSIYSSLVFLHMVSTIVESLYYNFSSLKLEWRYQTIFGLDMMLCLLFAILGSVACAHVKLQGSHYHHSNSYSSSNNSNNHNSTDLTWLEVTIPLWVFVTLGLGFLIYGLGRSYYDIFEYVLLVGSYVYFGYSVVITCTLAAVYCDAQESSTGGTAEIGWFGYVFIPLYPMFCGLLLGIIVKIITSLKVYYDYFIRHQAVGYGFNKQWKSDLVFLLLTLLSILCCVIIAVAVILLVVGAYEKGHNNHDDHSAHWEQTILGGVQLSPLQLALVIINAIQLFLVVFFFEDRLGY